MMRPAMILTILTVSACAPCDPAEELVLRWGPGLATWQIAGLDEVLGVAAERCAQPLVGRIEMVAVRPDPAYDGYCWYGHTCGIRAWVWVEVADQDVSAWDTALAHEIGHWCLQSGDEWDVRAWALAVEREAIARYFAAGGGGVDPGSTVTLDEAYTSAEDR